MTVAILRNECKMPETAKAIEARFRLEMDNIKSQLADQEKRAE